ncbi:MAG: glycosyl hydrolase family 65 protein, partial [Gemmatimonadales bacterium]
GNGYFATRGAAAEEAAGDVHNPGTYVAGCYNRLATEMAGRVIENEDLVNVPNWLPLTFRIEGGEWFDLSRLEILSYQQTLDLKQGMLARTVRFRDGEGRESTLQHRRLVHMSEPHLCALESTLTPENWSGAVEFRSALDGTVINSGVPRYRKLASRHLEPIETEPVDDETIYLKVQTNQSKVQIAQAARTRAFRDGKRFEFERRVIEEAGYIAHEFTLEAEQGVQLSVEKVVTLYTSRDQAIAECGLEARDQIPRSGSFGALLTTHAVAWGHLWNRFDIGITADLDNREAEHAAMVLRLHVFHLLQTVSLNSIELDVGVPARGLHGEAYRGHIFWDELYIFPFLNLRQPEITRALLRYRYRRLPEARAAAREAGCLGAMFPWQSGSNGREETQNVHLNPKSGRWLPDNSHLQRHVNAAIAYNVWQYYEATGDLQFMGFFGAEMLIEIARFWACLATYNEELDRYEILGVMGPDEYHDGYPDREKPGLDNNAYTNLMAAWVLSRALEIFHALPSNKRDELCEKLVLRHDEIEHWEDISTKMRVCFHDDGIISQFEGYGDLEEFDWEGYREKYGDIHRLDRILEAEGDTPNRYKLSKQADVLMLFYLFSAEELGELFERLGYDFDRALIPRNIEYYDRRTAHGSTLSRVVSAWVNARANRPGSWGPFVTALESDIADIQGGTTAEGIHLGAMAGTVDVVQRCYTGLETRGDTLWFNPRLPKELKDLRLRLCYRGHCLKLEMTSERMELTSLPSMAAPIKVRVRDEIHQLAPGETKVIEL